jgi:uncharacterized protein (TIGR03032 family)
MTSDGRVKQAMWTRHSGEWRDTAQVVSQWSEASNISPSLLRERASKGWWETLEQLGATLFVTREYEHLMIAMAVVGGSRLTTYLPIPHPSGLAIDRRNNKAYVASTRNPNQVFTLKPARAAGNQARAPLKQPTQARWIPVQSTSYPGGLYIHDLALFGEALHANAVGQNAVVRLEGEGRFERVWWPKCIESTDGPVFSRNHIQLNSIAAGSGPQNSYYSASSCALGRLRPGHLNYPIDRRGVIFSGRTREPICTGLTRPHSARLRGKELWVANSGYGELGYVRDGRLEVLCRLPGWTRGLCFIGNVAFVATSRVIPRFARYAPGLDTSTSRCAIFAFCCKTGRVLGSLEWPNGNQVFAIDWISSQAGAGLPFDARRRSKAREIALFYNYAIG